MVEVAVLAGEAPDLLLQALDLRLLVEKQRLERTKEQTTCPASKMM